MSRIQSVSSLRTLVAVAVGVLAGGAMAAKIAPGQAVVASLAAEGAPGTGDSYEGSASNNGRTVAFYSNGGDFGPEDGNNDWDVYVRDMKTGENTLVSADGTGAPGNGWSYYPTLSANGRYVLYYTAATNLAPGTEEGYQQVILHDRRKGTSRLVTASPGGEEGNGDTDLYNTRPLSGNGRMATFASEASNLVDGDSNDRTDVFLADMARGTMMLVSRGIDGPANGDSYYPSISPNGRWVVFVSEASNLVEGDDNDTDDVFLYDVRKGTITLESVATNGTPANGPSGYGAPAVSNSGRLVAFSSAATNLTADTDENGFYDIFLRDRRSGEVRMISPGFGGGESDNHSADVGISANGRLVTWWTYASNQVDATDSIPWDQILHDVATGENRRMLTSPEGAAPDDGAYGYFNGFSANGKWFVCTSSADNLSSEDGEGTRDVFLVRLK